MVVSGCAVYVPTVPSTPLLRNKGEVEATIAVRNLSSLEAGAAWSPVSHVLLTGEAALQTSKGSETYNNVTTNYRNVHRQVGIGVGTYRLLGKDQSTYLGIVGGVGVANVDVYNTRVLPYPTPVVRYQASYLRYYGQGYVARQNAWGSYGMSLRGTVVDYRQLLRAGVPLDTAAHFFVEPTLFVRVGRGALQAVGTLGFSIPSYLVPLNTERRIMSPVTSLVSVGVVVRPHLLWRKASAGPLPMD